MASISPHSIACKLALISAFLLSGAAHAASPTSGDSTAPHGTSAHHHKPHHATEHTTHHAKPAEAHKDTSAKPAAAATGAAVGAAAAGAAATEEAKPKAKAEAPKEPPEPPMKLPAFAALKFDETNLRRDQVWGLLPDEEVTPS